MKVTITHVRKDDKGVITHVKTKYDELTKTQVITNIISELITYVVPSGEKVHVVDGRYIRSDGNDTKEDNLGELPSF